MRSEADQTHMLVSDVGEEEGGSGCSLHMRSPASPASPIAGVASSLSGFRPPGWVSGMRSAELGRAAAAPTLCRLDSGTWSCTDWPLGEPGPESHGVGPCRPTTAGCDRGHISRPQFPI